MHQTYLDCTYLNVNVVLLQDGVSPWSMNFVRPALEKAIESDGEISYNNGSFFSYLCIIMTNRSLDIQNILNVGKYKGYTKSAVCKYSCVVLIVL